MKFLFPLFVFFNLSAQIDTTFVLCKENHGIMYDYFLVSGGNRLSSQVILEKVNQKLTTKSQNINGFITIRFIVNCKGEAGRFEVHQIDKNYKKANFDPYYVIEVLDFVKNLGNWKHPREDYPFNYKMYLSFKIVNGYVTEVIP